MKPFGLTLIPGLALALCLTACAGPKAPAPTPTPSPTPAAVLPSPTPAPAGPVNPLTGLSMGEEWVGRRPVAIMLNNLKQALPQQGQSQADIIYECLEEGGITRMMGVYQSLDGVGTVGSIRSARTYYLELALGHDAIFIHAGGSDEAGIEDAYGKISQWGVTSLDGVRGPYMSTTVEGGLMWRDPERRRNNGAVHSVVTTGEMIQKTLSAASFRTEHQEGWSYPMVFAADGAPAGGADAQTITVPFSDYKTGVFTYDAQRALYLAEEYGQPYVDGNTGEQVGVTNVLVLKTSVTNTGDRYGHVKVDLSSGGSGYFACGGKVTEIRWAKDGVNEPLRYTDSSGHAIALGTGRSYVCIVPTTSAITFE